MFSIVIKRFYWIDDSADNPDDLCLHGDVIVNIGNERFETSCTVSATALYLLKTLNENHIINEDNQMLPCCGHFYIPNETNDTVHISGCPNGIDWTILHVQNGVEITTESGAKTFIGMDAYQKAVFDFADKVAQYYKHCSPKTIPAEDFERKGYIAFWNEWSARRGALSDNWFCPAISKDVDIGLCWEYCFADNGAPIDTASKLKQWIADSKYKGLDDFHSVCGICTHCQWS